MSSQFTIRVKYDLSQHYETFNLYLIITAKYWRKRGDKEFRKVMVAMRGRL